MIYVYYSYRSSNWGNYLINMTTSTILYSCLYPGTDSSNPTLLQLLPSMKCSWLDRLILGTLINAFYSKFFIDIGFSYFLSVLCFNWPLSFRTFFILRFLFSLTMLSIHSFRLLLNYASILGVYSSLVIGFWLMLVSWIVFFPLFRRLISCMFLV